MMNENNEGRFSDTRNGHTIPPLNVQPPPSRLKKKAETLYSPKKVASAIGVSESSLKRWCDAGHIRATKTAGGHRRVTRADVIAFIKRKNYTLRDPTSIGLPDIRDVSIIDEQDAVNQFFETVKNADEKECSRLLAFLFLNGYQVADLFDRLICPAFKRVGELWRSGQMEVYQERMA